MRTLTLSMCLLAGCSYALATPSPAVELQVSSIAAMRARGPAALAELLDAYDAMAPGVSRDALALVIDRVAAQRYATVSRMYWYTDLGAAEQEAQRRHVPILSLRMLGHLDQDLSCANSRLFRSTLYANAELSQFLRDHFVLHWSSERDVPRVTVDFGNGRVLERTITGNSAHYVLDEHGRVLDVLPGVYAPVAFRKELEDSLALAAKVAPLDAFDEAAAVVAYQSDLASRIALWTENYAYSSIPDPHRLVMQGDIDNWIAAAQARTFSKAYIEAPDLSRYGYRVSPPTAADVSDWAIEGQVLYGIGLRAPSPFGVVLQTRVRPKPPHVLDAQSRVLIERLHDGVPVSLVAQPAQLTAMFDRLEQTLVADTAIDQLQLRPQIAQHIIETRGLASFEDLNTWVYAEVFETPRSDAWLGMLPRTDFTGLPGDGVVIR